eukprot:Protomagalhaensia_wolfi_Nauph_80__5650@NODE_655_length_2159_cov_4_939151_g490_i0_p1_GENE_NODE_655_length_2159_cov_4_939151_g490_i0NODE_655_length_2159_cov_4_939151_g490_i0_p1_ORF_typecomplete_len428_score70_17MSL2CXC/PF16682_5/67MSL2CXC/PF16682_5/1_8e02MSL2CXC/PF16682_5/32_NODE_655_length_2159_cov_4_939151_g490_i08492132
MGSACSSVEAYKKATEEAFFACLLSVSEGKLHVLRFARQRSGGRLPGISVAEFMRAPARPIALVSTGDRFSHSWRLAYRGIDIGLVTAQSNNTYHVSIGAKMSGQVSPSRPCLILNVRDPAQRHQLLTEAVLWGRASLASAFNVVGPGLTAEQRALIQVTCAPLKFQYHECGWLLGRSVFRCGLTCPLEEQLTCWEQLHWHLYFFHGLSRYYIAKYFSRCLCRSCQTLFLVRDNAVCRCGTRWATPNMSVELRRSLKDSKGGNVPSELDPFQHLAKQSDLIVVLPADPTDWMPGTDSLMSTAADWPNNGFSLDHPSLEASSQRCRVGLSPQLQVHSPPSASVPNLTSSRFPGPSDASLLAPPPPQQRDAWQELATSSISRQNPRLFPTPESDGDDQSDLISWPDIPEPELKVNLTGESFRKQPAAAA